MSSVQPTASASAVPENDGEKYLVEERCRAILSYVNARESASIPELMSQFGVSKSTIRRDLLDLERRNLITRTHGGALKKRFLSYESTLEEKEVLNVDKKRQIARMARQHVVDGDVIYISGGTTTLELARLLDGIEDLVVFTNAVNILMELANHPNVQIKFLGGDFRRTTFSCVGIDTITVMQGYRFGKTFIGANGISIEEGVTTPNDYEAKVDAEVIRRSGETYFLADETKFGTITHAVVCGLQSVNHLITNTEPPRELTEVLHAADVEVIYPGADE